MTVSDALLWTGIVLFFSLFFPLVALDTATYEENEFQKRFWTIASGILIFASISITIASFWVSAAQAS